MSDYSYNPISDLDRRRGAEIYPVFVLIAFSMLTIGAALLFLGEKLNIPMFIAAINSALIALVFFVEAIVMKYNFHLPISRISELASARSLFKVLLVRRMHWFVLLALMWMDVESTPVAAFASFGSGLIIVIIATRLIIEFAFGKDQAGLRTAFQRIAYGYAN